MQSQPEYRAKSLGEKEIAIDWHNSSWTTLHYTHMSIHFHAKNQTLFFCLNNPLLSLFLERRHKVLTAVIIYGVLVSFAG